MKGIIPFIIITFFTSGVKAQQMEQTWKVCNKVSYLISLPDSYSPNGEATPLLLNLRGSGERDNDLKKEKAWVPLRLIAEGIKFSSIVVSPQCLPDQRRDVYVLKQLLNSLIKAYNLTKIAYPFPASVWTDLEPGCWHQLFLDTSRLLLPFVVAVTRNQQAGSRIYLVRFFTGNSIKQYQNIGLPK